jgi:hypothetical protein
MLIIAGVIVFFVLRKRGVNDRPGIVPLNDRSGIVYSNGGKWVAVGRGAGGILYSDNGETWNPATMADDGNGAAPFGGGRGESVYSNGGKWVAVGRGAGGASGNSSILYYNDGEKWRSAQWTMVVVWVVEIKA